MNGMVDESRRALIEVAVGAVKNAQRTQLMAWIDTAFNGGLVIPRSQIEHLGLQQGSTTQAILADGHLVDMETFICYLEWFGKVYRTQVVANDGEFALLGTALLTDRRLTIDYSAKTVALDEAI